MLQSVLDQDMSIQLSRQVTNISLWQPSFINLLLRLLKSLTMRLLQLLRVVSLNISRLHILSLIGNHLLLLVTMLLLKAVPDAYIPHQDMVLTTLMSVKTIPKFLQFVLLIQTVY